MKNSTKVGLIVVLATLLTLSLSVAFAGNEKINATNNMTNVTKNMTNVTKNTTNVTENMANVTKNVTNPFAKARGALSLTVSTGLSPEQQQIQADVNRNAAERQKILNDISKQCQAIQAPLKRATVVRSVQLASGVSLS